MVRLDAPYGTSNLVATTALNYDPFARLIGQSHVKDTTTLGSYSVTYDANRRIDTMTTPDGLGEFNYDGSGQLLEADYNYQPDEEFSYDLTGNRTMTGYSTGPNNQLLAAGDLEFEYDGEGNRVKQTDISTDDYVMYQWDHRNRLSKITFYDNTDTKTKEIFYTYDTHNRRIRSQFDANGNGTIDSEQKIVYDADWKPGLEDIVLVFHEANNIQHRFLHGPGIDQSLVDEQPSQLQWLLPGQLGTITDVVEYNLGTDTTNNINHLTYTSFGQIASQTNPIHEPYYTYTAREWDGESNLYYYRARWYDPIVGRFVSEDPFGFNISEYASYDYAFNSPAMFRDASGMVPISCQCTLPGHSGGIATATVYVDCIGAASTCCTSACPGPTSFNGQWQNARSAPGDVGKLAGICANISSKCPGCSASDRNKLVASLLNATQTTVVIYAGTNTCERYAFEFEKQLPRGFGLGNPCIKSSNITTWNTGGYLSPRHAAYEVEFCDGTIVYFDNTGVGDDDHIFFPSDIPKGWGPTP